MRVACIAASKVPSRTANSIQVMKVCSALTGLGNDVRLWLPESRETVPWESLSELYALRHPFQISRVKSFKNLRRYDFATKSVLAGRRWGADLYYIWPLQAAAFASRLGLPTVLEVHDRPGGRFGPWLFKQFLSGSGKKRVLPITKALRDWLSDRFDRRLEEPFALISPMGVDLDAYQGLPSPESARDLLGLTQGLTVGYTGHLYTGRGMDLLVNLAEKNPEVHFLWVGGEEAAIREWRAQIHSRRLDNIHIQGFVNQDQIPQFQAACEILLMPYESKIAASSGGDTAAFASPMKLFEYLAAGRAILSSDLPVFTEVLNAQNAVLLPSGDTEAWNRELNRLISDKESITKLSANAKSDAENYSWLHRTKRVLTNLPSS
jgi:glycosyltransferase involved in cell wall biosynthesis